MVAKSEMRIIRSYVSSAYDLQKLRIQTGGRLYANFRAKLKEEIVDLDEIETINDDDLIDEEDDDDDDDVEIDDKGIEKDDDPDAPDKPITEEIKDAQVKGELSAKAKKLIEDLRKEYALLTEGIARRRTLPERAGFKGEVLITDFTELVLIHQYFQIEAQEKQQFTLINNLLENIPIYDEWLVEQKGIGPAFAGVFLGYFDPYKADYVSSFWAYCGLDVAPDGFARSKRKEHLVERAYIKKDGTEGKKMSTTYNPWLQAKLIGAVGPSLMRANSPYRKQYDNYKQRIMTDSARTKVTAIQCKKMMAEAKENGKDARYEMLRRTLWPPRRVHKAAIRYMLKELLKDFWEKWRKLEGLPTPPDYNEARRGYPHGGIAGLGDQPNID